jgi:hypothetical protein
MARLPANRLQTNQNLFFCHIFRGDSSFSGTNVDFELFRGAVSLSSIRGQSMQTDLNDMIRHTLEKAGLQKPPAKKIAPTGRTLKIALLLLPEIALEKKDRKRRMALRTSARRKTDRKTGPRPTVEKPPGH